MHIHMDYDATNKTDLKGITAMVISYMKEVVNAISARALSTYTIMWTCTIIN